MSLPMVVLLALAQATSAPATETSAVTPSDDIRINQVGYAPGAVKRLIVAETTADSFDVRDAQGQVRFSGPLTERGFWEDSGESLKAGDFSALKTPGRYTIAVAGKGVSHPFEIKAKPFDEALKAAMKSFYLQRASVPLEARFAVYLQRASVPLEARFAGVYARPAGHPDTRCAFHPSSGRSEGTLSSPGGWYDAGDCNKYVVNAGVTVVPLLLLFERYPTLLADRSLNIPESGNGVSDLLDEVRFELDWLLTMQDEDGGVFFKITSQGFPGMIMPHEDLSERFVVGKATSSTLELASTLAQAARVWRTLDAPFARRCEAAAVSAWRWAVAHPDVVFRNPSDIHTGSYSPTVLEDDFFLAAAQLLATTGGDEYLTAVKARWREVEMVEGGSWSSYVRNLGTYVLAERPAPVPEAERALARRSTIALAERLLARLERNPHRVPLERFVWASSADVLDEAIPMALAYEFTRDTRFLAGVVECTDWIFGRNATGYSFVTGFGGKRPMHIHHRTSEADGIDEPIPGVLVGGPNARREDDVARNRWGVAYASTRPAKSYVDLTGSFASNEICINWNGPLVFVLGFLEAQTDTLAGRR
jgi:endoglucanase